MNVENLWRIAKWEYRQARPSFGRRDLLYIIFILGILGGGVYAGATSGVSVSEGIYTAGVPADSPYRDVLASNEKFTVTTPNQQAFDRNKQDILVKDGTIYVADTVRSRAAAAELRKLVKSYNDQQMNSEKNQHAAFPIRVDIQYYDPVSGEVSDSAGEQSQADQNPMPTTNPKTLLEKIRWALFKYLGIIFIPLYKGYLMIRQMIMGAVPSSMSPGGVASPFPYQSLMLALVFFAPLNFVAQSYGSTFLKERLNRRGELMLASPVSAGDIVLGKTIPYLVTMGLAALVIAAFTGAGVIGAAAILPFIVTFLGAVFLAAMLSRSFKELTFVTVTVSVLLISFGFVPAMFSNIHPIALISPLTIVVEQMEGNAVSIAEFLFSTTPLTLVGVSLFGIGTGLYREEDMFAQKSIRGKILDALAAWGTTKIRIALVVAGLLPLVFTAELLALPFAIPFPQQYSMVFVLAVVAVVEEIAKTLPVYAAVKRHRITVSPVSVGITGVLAGGAFFLAEKLTAIVQIVGLQEISVATPAFGPQIAAGTEMSPLTTLGLLMAPLLLHIVTAFVGSIGAVRGKRGYLIGFATAILIHGVYDYMAVMMYA